MIRFLSPMVRSTRTICSWSMARHQTIVATTSPSQEPQICRGEFKSRRS
jgi:hypothetical protein